MTASYNISLLGSNYNQGGSGAAITVTVTPHWIYVDSNATVTYF